MFFASIYGIKRKCCIVGLWVNLGENGLKSLKWSLPLANLWTTPPQKNQDFHQIFPSVHWTVLIFTTRRGLATNGSIGHRHFVRILCPSSEPEIALAGWGLGLCPQGKYGIFPLRRLYWYCFCVSSLEISWSPFFAGVRWLHFGRKSFSLQYSCWSARFEIQNSSYFDCIQVILKNLHSLKLKIGYVPGNFIFQPTIFRGFHSLAFVSGRPTNLNCRTSMAPHEERCPIPLRRHASPLP